MCSSDLSLVQRQLEYILNDVHTMLRKQQFGDTLINDYFQKHIKDFKARAEREVRLALLLPKIVESEKISISEEELKKHFEQISQQTGQTIEAIEKFYAENVQRKQDLAHELERRRAIDALVANAKIK